MGAVIASPGARRRAPRRRGWEPVLAGPLARAARCAADEIAGELARRAPAGEPGLQGDAAAALLLARCGRPEAAAARLEAALLAAASRPMTISLFGGLAGVAWVLDELTGPQAGAASAHLDAALWRHLDVPRWEERFDLMSGLAGVGVLAAGRADPRARAIAGRVLGHLERAADVTATGATWRTPARFLPAARRARFPRGMLERGVAHGAPGVAGVLAQLVEAGVERARSRLLLEAAVAGLLTAGAPGRPGWCHGAAGIAGVLLRAGRALGRTDVEAAALGMLRDLPDATLTARASDASFCHGAAGIAHVHNAAFQLTGDGELRRRAVRWLAALLRMRRPGAGIAGYRALRLERGTARWTDDPTLLSGTVGIALVLLAAVEDREPTWQRLFLL